MHIDLVPGGYYFTNLVFWSVVAMVVVGTTTVAFILSVGMVTLVLDAVHAGGDPT